VAAPITPNSPPSPALAPTPTGSPLISAPARILIIRPSALGDVCRSVPLLTSLRRAWPAARIDWLVNSAFSGAIAAHPALSGVVPFDRRALGRWWSPRALHHLRTFLAGLRSAHYDLVIDAQGLARSALFARVTGAPIRIGPADARECGTLGYTIAAPVSQTHTVDRMLELLAPFNIDPVRDLRLYAPADALTRLHSHPDLRTKRYAILAPTSRWPGKRWAPDRFTAVAGELLRRHANQLDAVVIVGAASERDQCGPLLAAAAANSAIIDCLGKTSVADLMALVASASLVIANDSAAVHMATGFNRPMVALYGPTDIAKVGPYHQQSSVIQHRRATDVLDHKNTLSGLDMMDRITIDQVLAQADASLRTPP